MTTLRRAGIAAAICVLCVPAGAAAQERSEESPPTELAFVQARVVRAALIELAPDVRFLLVALADPSATAAWDVGPEIRRSRVFSGALACRQIYITIGVPEPTIDGPAIAALVGKSFDVAVVPPASASEWCGALVGHAHLWPGGTHFESRRWEDLGKQQKDAILPALRAIRELFVGTGGDGASPLDGLIGDALDGLDSRAGFEFALEHRLYFDASRHFKWSHDAALFPVIAADLLGRPWPMLVPSGFQVELFWKLSPTRARAAVLELAAREPDKAGTILRMSPARPEALATFRALYEAGTWKRFAPPRDLLRAGVLLDLIEDVAGRSVDERETRELRSAVELAATRRSLGVTDGISLTRHLAGQPDTYDVEAPFIGMQVSFTGAAEYCCNLLFPLSDVATLDVDVDCDAESFRRTCDQPDRTSPLEVTGRVVSASARTRDKGGEPHVFVDIKLDDATAVPVAVAPTSVPASAPPPAQVSTSGGCGCELDGAPAGAWLWVGLMALVRRRFR